MQIDSCGKFSDMLNEILDEKINDMKLNGEKITLYKINTLDMGLFEAYQKILSIAEDGDTITKALQYFSEQSRLGNVDIPYMTKIAESSAIQAKEDIEMQTKISNGITIVSAGAIALSAYNIMEANLIENICTSKMEDMHKETFNKAKMGDEKAVNVLDLINRSAAYLSMSDKLNSKGKDAGALALISHLVRTQDKQAIEMAKDIAEHFGLNDIIDENGISIERVEAEFGKRFPKINLEEVSQRMSKNAIANSSKVLEKSQESFRGTVEGKIETKKINEFRRQLGNYLKTGKSEEAEELVRANSELAEKAFDFWDDFHREYIVGKKPENVEQNAIQNSLGKMLGKTIDIERDGEER